MANYFGGYSPPQQQYQQPSNNIIVVPVQGEQGASMYPVAAGNTVFLFDFNAKRFWIKATDINCLPSRFSAFDFTEVKPAVQSDTSNFVFRNEFEEIKNRLEYLTSLIGGKDSVSATVQQSPATQATV